MLISRILDERTPASRSGRIAALTTRDARADDAARRVNLGLDVVSIERRYKGIRMSLAVPVSAYEGVTMAPVEGGYEVHLVHRDPDLSVPLHLASDGSEAVAQLHCWAQLLDLPALDGRDGTQSVALALPHGRAGGVPASRRPRFLKRRKAGRPERMGIVHRNEREIIARN